MLSVSYWFITGPVIPKQETINENAAIELVKNKYSDLKEYYSNQLPPKSIKTEKAAGGWYAVFAEPTRSSDADMLAHWISAQQFSNPELPSYGGVKIHPGVAATSADGKQYQRVSPYFANLGVLGMLRTKSPGYVNLAENWIRWYFAHLNKESAPDGVPYEHFYLADGGGETTCVKPGDPFLCHYNDATDSAAATFFSVLWAAHEAGIARTTLNTPERKKLVETLAEVLLKLQQTDGLYWAKSDYRVKYLEDNSEVFAGLRDLANLERDVFNDAERSTFYKTAANRVQQAILKELYDPKAELYAVAKFEDNSRPAADLDKWYPDTQAQSWPHLFGVVPPTDPKTKAVMSAVNARWSGQTKPDWAANPDRINNGWIEAGDAYAALLTGDTWRVRKYIEAVKRLKFPKSADASDFEWPFSVTEAGWLLQIVTRIPN